MGCGFAMNFGKEKNCETETEIIPYVFFKFILQEQSEFQGWKPNQPRNPRQPHKQ